MIGIATITSNINGAFIFRESSGSRMREMEARISRDKTLDGGVVIDHRGFSNGDRTFRIRLMRITQDQVESLNTLFQVETLFIVATKDGCFLAAMQWMAIDSLPLEMTILVKEKISS